MSNTRAVIEFARHNGGVFTSHDAMALGMASTTLARRVDDGVFVRINRGMLAPPARPPGPTSP